MVVGEEDEENLKGQLLGANLQQMSIASLQKSQCPFTHCPSSIWGSAKKTEGFYCVWQNPIWKIVYCFLHSPGAFLEPIMVLPFPLLVMGLRIDMERSSS